MDEKPDLNSAYALQTPDDNLALYKAWARTYDSDFMAKSRYVLHIEVAKAFHATGIRGPVLDVGAGTGGVGEVLHDLGHHDLHATDLSGEMLVVAAEKGVYASTFEGNILTGLDRPDGAFAGIVSAGTFTLGHVGPDGLDDVIRLLAPGGIAVISVRDAHYESAGFAAKIARLEPDLEKVTAHTVPIYDGNPDEAHANDTALLLHLKKPGVQR